MSIARELLLILSYFIIHLFSLIFFLTAFTLLMDNEVTSGAFFLVSAAAIFVIETIAFGRIKAQQMKQALRRHPRQVGETVANGEGIETGISVDENQKDVATIKESLTIEGRKLNLTLPKEELMPQMCPRLTRMSSVVVKCPKCHFLFLRFFATTTPPLTLKNSDELELLKKGELSLMDILKRAVRESDYQCPSAFNCPVCRTRIVRSREPSGVCKANGERVVRRKLFECTINECHLND